MNKLKKALTISIISFIVCCAILVGATYAWFTDEASSTGNKIVAGNLDVDLVMYDGTEYKSIATLAKPIFGSGSIAQDDASESLWEPGKTQYACLGIQNSGNLALKYSIIIDVTDGGLVGALEYVIVSGDNTAFTATSWNDVKAYAQDVAAGRLTINTGILDEIVNGESNETDYFVIAVHMKETAGNDFKDKSITIDVKVVATQYTAESDAFGSQYDNCTPWLGGYDDAGLTANTDSTKKVVKIYTAEQLASFSKSINNGFDYSAYTIKLENDIDLNNFNWVPIGNFKSITLFDGQNHKVSNLTVNMPGEGDAGLFGAISYGSFKDLTIENANITAGDYAGALIGKGYKVYVDNVNVKNAKITCNPFLVSATEYDGGAKAGALIGLAAATIEFSLENCSAEDCVITAYRDLGGLIGMTETNTSIVSNNTVKNVQLIINNEHDYKNNNYVQDKYNVGSFVGRKVAGVTITDNTESNVTVSIVPVKLEP